ncbi:hypothetical protein F320042A7_02670 [Blautia producta]
MHIYVFHLERIQCLFSCNGGADGTYKADAYEADRKPETIAAFEEWHEYIMKENKTEGGQWSGGECGEHT